METLLIALVAGLVGGVGAKLLELRGHRIANLRERQLDAADDFASAATAVLIRLGANMEGLGTPVDGGAEWLESFRKAVGETRQGVHDVTGRLARVELLFGREQLQSSTAVQVVEALHRMSAEIAKPQSDVAVVAAAFQSSADALGTFTDAVHEALTTPVWKPVGAQKPTPTLALPHTDDSESAT
jgi:hypothetical protein